MTDETLIADLVRAGVDPDLIGRVANAVANATVHPTTADKRRAWDRERKRNKRAACPPDSGGIPPDTKSALFLKEVNKKEKKERAAERKHCLPTDWRPEAPLTAKGEEEFAKLKDWARANAIRKADWAATWRSWVRRTGGGCEEVVRLVASNDQYVSFDSPEMVAWEAHERATGKKYPRDKRGGWTFPTRWPQEARSDLLGQRQPDARADTG